MIREMLRGDLNLTILIEREVIGSCHSLDVQLLSIARRSRVLARATVEYARNVVARHVSSFGSLHNA